MFEGILSYFLQDAHVLIVSNLVKQFSDDNIYHKCLEYIAENGCDYDHIYALYFRHNIAINDMFYNELKMRGCKNISSRDMEFHYDRIIELNTHAPTALDMLDFPTEFDADIIGCDIHTSTLALCYKLWEQNVKFRILTQYTYGLNPNAMQLVYDIIPHAFGNNILKEDVTWKS